MAYYNRLSDIDFSDNSAFDEWHNPGEITEISGIYQCRCGNFEAACDKGFRFPTHNPECRNVKWRLIVATKALED